MNQLLLALCCKKSVFSLKILLQDFLSFFTNYFCPQFTHLSRGDNLGTTLLSENAFIQKYKQFLCTVIYFILAVFPLFSYQMDWKLNIYRPFHHFSAEFPRKSFCKILAFRFWCLIFSLSARPNIGLHENMFNSNVWRLFRSVYGKNEKHSFFAIKSWVIFDLRLNKMNILKYFFKRKC